ncbi:hypothetical protein IMZ48_49030 [Candidatus Bathyarchaeota archaeon]|nr:hypothetical protein [Candidatus Bathyarchaeota archaeon]
MRSHFVWAEVVQALNLLNLTNLYFLHSTSPTLIHLPVVAGPLAWAYVGLYWNGALMLHHPDHFVPRVLGNIFVWSIPVFGYFCLFVFKVSFGHPGEEAIGGESKLTSSRTGLWDSV